MDRLRRETGLPTVAVAQAWLDRADLGATLAALARFDFVRGIRHKPRPGQMADVRWLSGFALLCERGLRFDLQAPWTQLEDAAQLALAARPNAALKVSGLGVPGNTWTAQANREIVLTAIDVFGVGRSMFASNFPVDGLCASFDAIVSGLREIVRDFRAAEQRAFFHDNAIRIYDMERT